MLPDAAGARSAPPAAGVKTARIGPRSADCLIAGDGRKTPMLQRTRRTRVRKTRKKKKSKNERTEATYLPPSCELISCPVYAVFSSVPRKPLSFRVISFFL